MKNKKGFTLIELLAVIVILGLLMAIAVPSITRYIVESRKNTMTTTINNYINAVINEVNDLEYTFTEENTIYALPIECIAVERGGRNPFGEWHQANDSYWAYVLIQYDSDNSTYRYGFTYKDSAGYGLYPISQKNFGKSNQYIKTGLNLTRPRTGNIKNLTPIENWGNSGLEVNEMTKINVLVSEREGVSGDGITTCTLAQKGNNYEQVEQEKEQEELNKVAYALILNNSGNPSDSKPMVFIRTLTEINVGDIYTSATYGEKEVLYVYKNFDKDTYTFNGSKSTAPWANQSQTITSVIIEDKIKPVSTAGWFTKFSNVSNFDLTNLDVSLVKDMSYMFYSASSSSAVKNVKVIGLNNWNVSNVTDMTGMFYQFGRYVTDWSIGDISKWNTVSLKTTEGMFSQAGTKSVTWKLDVSGWDVQNVENMSYMFAQIAYTNTNTSLNLIGVNNWKPNSLKNMDYMFYEISDAANIIDLSSWNIEKSVLHDEYRSYSESKVIPPKHF